MCMQNALQFFPDQCTTRSMRGRVFGRLAVTYFVRAASSHMPVTMNCVPVNILDSRTCNALLGPLQPPSTLRESEVGGRTVAVGRITPDRPAPGVLRGEVLLAAPLLSAL